MKVTRAGVDRSASYLPDEFDAINIVLVGWDGEVGLGSMPIPDPAGDQEPYEGEQLLLEQDTLTIVDGFLGAVGTTRGPTVGSTRRVHTVNLGDDNALLQGHATPGWSRPAEAPAARWLAFVLTFVPSLDTTWLLTTNESGVTLPAKTYRTDSLFDDLSADTIRPTGKTVYAERRRFHWHLPTEGQTCALTIDDTADNSGTAFFPTTTARLKDGLDLRNEIYARNDAGVVVSTSDATSISRHNSAGLKHQGFAEYGTDSAADMLRDINVTKAERKDERVTWTYTIGPLTAAQAVELIPGSQMTTTVAVHGLSAAVKRIARVSLTYRHGPDDRRFIATVELGYPVRKRHKPTKTTSATGGDGTGGGGGSGGSGGDCHDCPPVSIGPDGPEVCTAPSDWHAGPNNTIHGTVTFPPCAPDTALVSCALPGNIITCVQDTDGNWQNIGQAIAVSDDWTGGGYFKGRVALPPLAAGQYNAISFHGATVTPATDTTGPYVIITRDGTGTFIQAVNGVSGSPGSLVDLGIGTAGAAVLNFKLDMPSSTTFRVKAWPDGGMEPDWQSTGTRGSAADPDEIHIFFFATNSASMTTVVDSIYWCHAVDAPVAIHGQMYGPVFVATADGSTSAFTLPAYPGNGVVDGTLDARVDGVTQPATVTDPTAPGTFDFGVDPAAGDTITAVWRVPS